MVKTRSEYAALPIKQHMILISSIRDVICAGVTSFFVLFYFVFNKTLSFEEKLSKLDC